MKNTQAQIQTHKTQAQHANVKFSEEAANKLTTIK